MERVCAILPHFLRSECSNLVGTYGAKIVSWLESLSPEEICQKVRCCSSSSSIAVVAGAPASARKGDMCGTCKLVAMLAEQWVTQNKSVSEIEALLEKACDLLPASLKTECVYIFLVAP